MDNELNLEIDIFIPHSKNPDVNMRYENIYFFTRESVMHLPFWRKQMDKRRARQ